MDESKLNGTQVALLFGAVCLASAIGTGLIIRKIQKVLTKDPNRYGFDSEDNPLKIK